MVRKKNTKPVSFFLKAGGGSAKIESIKAIGIWLMFFQVLCIQYYKYCMIKHLKYNFYAIKRINIKAIIIGGDNT